MRDKVERRQMKTLSLGERSADSGVPIREYGQRMSDSGDCQCGCAKVIHDVSIHAGAFRIVRTAISAGVNPATTKSPEDAIMSHVHEGTHWGNRKGICGRILSSC